MYFNTNLVYIQNFKIYYISTKCIFLVLIKNFNIIKIF